MKAPCSIYQSHKFGDPRDSDSRDILFLICRKTLPELMFKGYVNIWAEVPHCKSSPSHVWCPLLQWYCVDKGIYCCMTSQNHMSHGSWKFLNRHIYCMPPPYQSWWPLVLKYWRYGFILSCDLARPHDFERPCHACDQMAIWLSEWELPEVNHSSAKFSGDRHMVLVCQMISKDHKVKGSCDFMMEGPSC